MIIDEIHTTNRNGNYIVNILIGKMIHSVPEIRKLLSFHWNKLFPTVPPLVWYAHRPEVRSSLVLDLWHLQ